MVEPMEISKPYRDSDDGGYRDNENGVFYDDSGDNAMVMKSSSEPTTAVRKGRWHNNKWIVLSIVAAIVVILIAGVTVSKGNGSGAVEEFDESKAGKGVYNPHQDVSPNLTLLGEELVGPTEKKKSSLSGYGHHVAMSYDGHRIVVGVTSDPNDLEYGGTFDVFSWNHTKWTLEKRVVDPKKAHVHTGVSHQAVAISGDGHRIASTQGDEVAVFFKTSSYEKEKWHQIGDTLQPYKDDKERESTQFGVELCLSADGMTLATIGYTDKGGYVRVYYDKETVFQNTDPVDRWEAYPDIPIHKEGGSISLSKDGKRIAVATKVDDEDAGSLTGVVKVFDLDEEAKTWSLVGDPIRGDQELGELGGKVSLSRDGKVVAVGAGGNGSGVRVYKYMLYYDTLAWQQFGKPFGEELGSENYGTDVALNHDGTVLAVGAPGQPSLLDDTDVDLTQKQFFYGSVYLYQFDYKARSWSEIGKAGSGYQGDAFGGALALAFDGKRVVVGAPLRTMQNVANVGAVRVYDTNVA